MIYDSILSGRSAERVIFHEFDMKAVGSLGSKLMFIFFIDHPCCTRALAN